MRYAGQNYELPVTVPDGPVTAATLDRLAEGFAAAPERMYGFVAENEPVQLVTCRIEAIGVVRKARTVPQPLAGAAASRALVRPPEHCLAEASTHLHSPA